MAACTRCCVLGGGRGSGLTINHLLPYSVESSAKGSPLIIYDIMNEVMGKKFSPKDPDDGMYRNCLCNTEPVFRVLVSRGF